MSSKITLQTSIDYLFTAQKIKFSIKDFLNRCDQIRRELRIWSHLLKKSLMQNFIYCAVLETFNSRMSMRKTPASFQFAITCILPPFSLFPFRKKIKFVSNSKLLMLHYCRYKNLLMSPSSHTNDMPKVSHYDCVYFLRYTHPRL